MDEILESQKRGDGIQDTHLSFSQALELYTHGHSILWTSTGLDVLNGRENVQGIMERVK